MTTLPTIGSFVEIQFVGNSTQRAIVEGFTRDGRPKVRAWNRTQGKWMPSPRTIDLCKIVGLADGRGLPEVPPAKAKAPAKAPVKVEPADEARQAQTLEMLRGQVEEVLAGRRGFIQITRISQQSGVAKDTLKALCERAGLVTANHGRYGLNASLPYSE